MQLPLVENWQMEALVTYTLFWIPIQDELWFKLNDVTANIKLKLAATNFGRLSPKIEKMYIDFGTSDIHSMNFFHQEILRQFVTPLRYFLENALSLFGANMFNRQMQGWTNQYF